MTGSAAFNIAVRKRVVVGQAERSKKITQTMFARIRNPVIGMFFVWPGNSMVVFPDADTFQYFCRVTIPSRIHGSWRFEVAD